jgi:hypothetical protein
VAVPAPRTEAPGVVLVPGLFGQSTAVAVPDTVPEGVLDPVLPRSGEEPVGAGG